MPATHQSALAQLDEALRLYRAGRYAAAAHTCRNALGLDPGLAAAHHYLGLAEHALGHTEASLRELLQALELDPSPAGHWFNLGTVLLELGNNLEAIGILRQGAAHHPEDMEMRANLALALERNEQIEEALGVWQKGKQTTDALLGAARCLQSLERFSEAEASCRSVLDKNPRSAEAWLSLAAALREQQRLAEALAAARKAHSLAPGATETANSLGVLLRETGQAEEALALLRTAHARRPEARDIAGNLAAVLADLGHPEEAEPLLTELLSKHPDYARGWNSLGNLLMDLRRVNEAIGAYDRALDLMPDNALWRWNRSLALLLQGKLREGFADYENRLRLPRNHHLYLDRPPLWRGEPLAGRSLLVTTEQGFGDTLQFVRLLPEVERRFGGQITLWCEGPLLRLLGETFRVADRAASPPTADFSCPLLSLPQRLGLDLDGIPTPIPYLAPPAAAKGKWREKLAGLPRPRIGLVWAGASRRQEADANLIDRRRSLAPAQLKPLLTHSGIAWVSLQFGASPDELAELPGIINVMEEVADFADTAAILGQLDLLISVDTSVVHLAGGLGVPTWVLSRFDGCWRWLLDRDDSPWYPGLRLFRQRTPGIWADVLASIDAALAERYPQALQAGGQETTAAVR